MIDSLRALMSKAQEEIAAAGDLTVLGELQIQYLGRKGALAEIMKGMGKLSAEERPAVGKLANEVKTAVTEALAAKTEALGAGEKASRFAKAALDVTRPGRAPFTGNLHPLTQVVREMLDIFSDLGFQIAVGREVEDDYHNFEALNIPADHPARDMQDTFYVAPGTVLRTHTSPVQVRVMENTKPPVKIVAPGKVYRHDSDVTHSPMFHQVEGLLVEEGISFADLKGVLHAFLHRYYGKDTPVRFRPSFFPFTEPSAEVDIQCVMCGGAGCRVCSQTGWLEILGSGMVDPAVYGFVDYDPETTQGFAFGIGVERLAMLKYGIGDIRLFYENDLRFLRHFG